MKNEALPQKYSHVTLYGYKGYAEVSLGDYVYLVSSDRRISTAYKYTSYDNEGELIKVSSPSGMYGLVDTSLHVLVKYKYKSLGYLRSGLIYAKEDSLYGYINKTGDWKLQPIYDDANSFDEGYAVVKYKRKYGVIKTNGDFIVPNEFNKIIRHDSDLFVVCRDGKYGVFDAGKSKMVVPCEYCNDFKYITHNRFPVLKNGKWGILASDGRCTLDYYDEDFNMQYPISGASSNNEI